MNYSNTPYPIGMGPPAPTPAECRITVRDVVQGLCVLLLLPAIYFWYLGKTIRNRILSR